jgi:hypothetical protein
LIDDHGHVQLSGFGHITISEDETISDDVWIPETTRGVSHGFDAWIAPELVDNDEKAQPTTVSDVFAYACLCYLVCVRRQILHPLI